MQPSCSECQGSGRIVYRDCPFKHVGQGETDVVTAAILLESGGLLPAAGGWFEQTAIFLDAVAIVLREKAKYDKLEQERLAREFKRNGR